MTSQSIQWEHLFESNGIFLSSIFSTQKVIVKLTMLLQPLLASTFSQIAQLSPLESFRQLL